MGFRGPKVPSDPVEPIEFDKLHLNPSFYTNILLTILLSILILGLRPHMEPIEATLTRPLKNPRVANPRELKPWEKRIPCITIASDWKSRRIRIMKVHWEILNARLSYKKEILLFGKAN